MSWTTPSGDGTAEAVRALRPTAIVVENTENTGFARANNQALPGQAAPGQWLCLLNPDTQVPVGALESLRQALEQDPRLGIVGPRLVNPDGSFQSGGPELPHAGQPGRRRLALGQARPEQRGTRFGAGRPPDSATGSSAPDDQSREVLEQVGLLDEGDSMYGEEEDLRYRARQAGWQGRLPPHRRCPPLRRPERRPGPGARLGVSVNFQIGPASGLVHTSPA